MPRKARIDYPGALHHIIIRGIERKLIFRDDQDRHAFMDRLGRYLLDSATPCYAWTLMPNHVHLLLMTGGTSITRVMQSLLTSYAYYFNRRHKRAGYLFQNRYKSICCERESYFLELVRYIHLNAIRAKIVTTLEELKYFPWCGHSTIMGNNPQPWHDVTEVLENLASNPEIALKSYCTFMADGLQQEKQQDFSGGGLIRSYDCWEVKKARQAGVYLRSDERILGDSDFVEKAIKHIHERIVEEDPANLSPHEIKTVLKQIAAHLDVDVEELMQGNAKKRVLSTARALSCTWLRDHHHLPLTTIATMLSITPQAAYQCALRGQEIIKTKGTPSIFKQMK